MITKIQRNAFTKIARFWDLAAGTKTYNDYTCGAKAALTDNGYLILIDIVRGRWEWPDAIKVIRQTALSDGPEVTQGIEDVGVQKGLYQLVIREPLLVGITFRAIKVVTDKMTRANPWIARAEQGKFALVRGAWNTAFLDEACAFPESTHDDQVDALSGATAMIATPQRTWRPVGP